MMNLLGLIADSKAGSSLVEKDQRRFHFLNQYEYL